MKKKKLIKANIDKIITLFLIFIFSFLFYQTAQFPVAPRRFPLVILLLLIILSIFQLFFSGKSDYEITQKRIKSSILKNRRMFLLAFFSLIYIFFLIKHLGFYSSTFVFLFFTIRNLGGQTKISFITALVTAVILYLFFRLWLRVYMPMGILI